MGGNQWFASRIAILVRQTTNVLDTEGMVTVLCGVDSELPKSAPWWSEHPDLGNGVCFSHRPGYRSYRSFRDTTVWEYSRIEEWYSQCNAYETRTRNERCWESIGQRIMMIGWPIVRIRKTSRLHYYQLFLTN